MVGRCKLDPGLKAPRFQTFDTENDNSAFNLNLVSELAPLHHGDYKGGRKAPHILSYLRRRLSRETVVQLSADAAAGFVDNSNGDNPVYLLVGGALETTPEGRAFEAVAEKRQEFDWFGHVPEPVPDAVLAVLGADRASLPAVVAVSPRSGAEAHSEEVDEAGLERFCNATKLPVVVELEQSVFPTVANSPRPSLLILQSAKTSQVEAACKRLEEALEPVARRHRMAAQFATVDMDKLGEWVRDEMGIVNPRVPTVVVYAKHADMMWFEEDWRERSRTEPEAVDSLLKSFMTREVTPTPLKTSPVMRKVEYYIATYPKIAIGMAFVPVVLAFLWWCTASSADEKTMRARRAVALERQMGRARADAAETVAKGEGSSAGAGGATQRRGAKRVD